MTDKLIERAIMRFVADCSDKEQALPAFVFIANRSTLIAAAITKALASSEDGPPYAADDWKEQGYKSPEEEIDDMARVGRALVERIASITKDGPFKGWSPMDCPSEIVTDLIDHIADNPPPEAPQDRGASQEDGR